MYYANTILGILRNLILYDLGHDWFMKVLKITRNYGGNVLTSSVDEVPPRSKQS